MLLRLNSRVLPVFSRLALIRSLTESIALSHPMQFYFIFLLDFQMLNFGFNVATLICHVKLKEKNVTRHLRRLRWKVMKTSCRPWTESVIDSMDQL